MHKEDLIWKYLVYWGDFSIYRSKYYGYGYAIVFYLGLSVSIAFCLCYCPRYVIGQVAKQEWIAALMKIVTVVNLYFYFLFPKNTRYNVRLEKGSDQLRLNIER